MTPSSGMGLNSLGSASHRAAARTQGVSEVFTKVQREELELPVT